MRFKTLIALAVAGAFAVPLAAQASADGDRMILAQAGGPAGASSVGRGPTGGTPSPQTAGEPATQRDRAAQQGAATAGATGMAAPMFSTLDTNGDGQISRAEWDAHHRAGAASGGATTGSSSSSTTGTTAGPGEASNRTGTGSATATTPSTSGEGKAK